MDVDKSVIHSPGPCFASTSGKGDHDQRKHHYQRRTAECRDDRTQLRAGRAAALPSGAGDGPPHNLSRARMAALIYRRPGATAIPMDTSAIRCNATCHPGGAALKRARLTWMTRLPIAPSSFQSPCSTELGRDIRMECRSPQRATTRQSMPGMLNISIHVIQGRSTHGDRRADPRVDDRRNESHCARISNRLP
jgi:hypothetical protein